MTAAGAAAAAPDVLVVGAGPTGLFLAGELAHLGLAVRLVEKEPAAATTSRALAVHARTLEVLERAGMAQDFIARGVPLRGSSVHARARRIVHFSFDELRSRYPFVLSVPQRETEAVLAAHAEAAGVRVERGVALTALRAEPDAVVAAVEGRRDGATVREEVRARWLVGCDGAHSAVRKLAGLGFEGHGSAEVFALADVRASGGEYDPQELVAFFGEDGVAVVIPMPGGLARVVASVTEAARAEGEAAPRPEPPTLAQMQEMLARRSGGADLRIDHPTWLSAFRVHYRLAPRYRQGRVFLAGDAAHIHSPLGGQGMNTGLQDAANLAFKLALVHRGIGRSELLDSYEAERRAVAQAVLESTERATQVATLRSPVGRAIRDRLARFLTSLEVVQQRIRSQASGLAIEYPESPVIAQHQPSILRARIGSDRTDETATVRAWRAFAAAPGAGARAPDASAEQRGRSGEVRLFELLSRRHSLLLFDGEAPTKAGYENLGAIAQRVRERFKGVIDPHLVVPRRDLPHDVDWDGSLLVDTDGELEAAYGSRAECLYLVRPDGVIGYRSQPADAAKLFAYLDRVFI